MLICHISSQITYVCGSLQLDRGLSGPGSECDGLSVRQIWVLALPLTVQFWVGKSLTSVGLQRLLLPALLVGVVRHS